MDKQNFSSSKARYSRYYTYIKPVLKNPLVKSFAPTIFSFITIIVLTIFVLRPTISTILDLQKRAQDSRHVLDTLNKKGEGLVSGKQNLDAINPQVRQRIDNIIPDAPNITALINTLQTDAQASVSAFQIQPLTLLDTTTRPSGLNLGEISFSLNIQGSYTQLLTALYNFSKTPRLVRIESINIGKREDLTILSVSGKAFYLK